VDGKGGGRYGVPRHCLRCGGRSTYTVLVDEQGRQRVGPTTERYLFRYPLCTDCMIAAELGEVVREALPHGGNV
jgi:hypothetical protein